MATNQSQYEEMCDIFKKYQKGELAPVEHAHWIETYDYTGTYYITCSNPKCGLVWWLEEGNAKDNEMFYCPKCGAIMDEEVE